VIAAVLIVGSLVAAVTAGLLVRSRMAAQMRELRVSLDDLGRELDVVSRSRDLLCGVLDDVRDGIVVVDGSGRTLARNAVAAWFSEGRHGDALVDHTLAELLTRARSGEVCEQEVTLMGPPRRVVRIYAQPLGEGAEAFVRDVSVERRADTVRRDFVANVSHELKTPVGALAVLTEAMADEHDAETLRRLALRAHGEAERLTRIVNDLLDLSSIEAQVEPRREPADARALVAEALARVEADADRAGIDITVDAPDGIMVACQRRQIVSALGNLLENAVKYSERGGQVTLSVHADDAAVAFSIEDEGIGIPARDLQRVFERFYRVDPARSRDTGGTGLGLSIVRHIALAHGGEVTVRSVEGEGSTFVMRIPIVPATGAQGFAG
jgi:two-component system sensor histidine kinase SenX3